MFLLQKLVSRLVFPVPIGLILGVLGVVLVWRSQRFRRLGIGLVAGALAFGWLLSTAPVSDTLLWSLEGRHMPVSEVPEEAGLIVVLGGGHVEREGFGPSVSLSQASRARVVEGVRLAGLSELPVAFTGYEGAGEVSSAEMGRAAAVELGLAGERAVTFPGPRNTAEEASTIAEHYGRETVLLVTSAGHMPRALYLFERAGVKAVPAPTDFRAGDRNYSPWSLFPSAAALANTERAWYEMLGLVWAWLGGG